MLAHRDGERVRVISRHGRDWGDRFPTIVAAVEALAVRSCVIDGEVIACDGDGLASFELLRYHRRDDPVTLVAFDLIEFDGRDLRFEPIEDRKVELTRLLVSCRPALVVNRVFDAPGTDVFQHACQLGCEGIVSKRRGSRYAGGRTHDWLKVKNPDAPAVRREVEGDWSR
jgi:bifunctional non-homologous end joining protein LigD